MVPYCQHFLNNFKLSLLFLKGSVVSCCHACFPCCCSTAITRTQMEIDQQMSDI